MPPRRRALHDRIVEILREEVRARYRPGDRLPPESKQAERFNVSLVTVREALLRLVQEGLIERRQGSGTYVLDAAARHPNIILLVSLDQLTSKTGSFPRCVARAVQDRLTRQQMNVHIQVLEDSPATDVVPPVLLEQLRGGQVDGVVAITAAGCEGLRPAAATAGVPVVSIASQYDNHVTGDNAGMVRAAIDFLLDHGRRRLALLQYAHPDRWHPPGSLFHDTFRDYLTERGVECREDWICHHICPRTPGSGWEHVHSIWSNGGAKPDGLFVSDDTIFREAVPAILDLGIRVPEDLLVVTHANRGGDLFYPFPTVRIEFDPDDYAAALTDALNARLAGADDGDVQIVPFLDIDAGDLGG